MRLQIYDVWMEKESIVTGKETFVHSHINASSLQEAEAVFHAILGREFFSVEKLKSIEEHDNSPISVFLPDYPGKAEWIHKDWIEQHYDEVNVLCPPEVFLLYGKGYMVIPSHQGFKSFEMFTKAIAYGKEVSDQQPYAVYRSSVADICGELWAPTIHDERITSMETLEKLAKQVVEDSLPKHLKEG